MFLVNYRSARIAVDARSKLALICEGLLAAGASRVFGHAAISAGCRPGQSEAQSGNVQIARIISI